MLVVAIYSGAIATNSANSHDYINISMAILCGVACALFVKIKDKKEV